MYGIGGEVKDYLNWLNADYSTNEHCKMETLCSNSKRGPASCANKWTYLQKLYNLSN